MSGPDPLHPAPLDLEPPDPQAPTPVFEQVRTQIAGRVASGALPPGTKLPTVRGLAGQLGLAVNTVAKAYRELEADGVVVTEGRRGTFVRSGAAVGDPEVRAAAATFVATARRAGLGLADARRVVEAAWAEAAPPG